MNLHISRIYKTYYVKLSKVKYCERKFIKRYRKQYYI